MFAQNSVLNARFSVHSVTVSRQILLMCMCYFIVWKKSVTLERDYWPESWCLTHLVDSEYSTTLPTITGFL